MAEYVSYYWKRTFPTGFCQEGKGILQIGWALILTMTLQVSLQPIATVFAGHLGTLELDAVSLANLIINIFGNAIVIGFATSLDTLLSQCYGRGNSEALNIYFQRGVILHVLLLMPCYVMHLNIEPILVALGQSIEVSSMTADYLVYFTPGLFFLFMWTVLKKYTQCQNIVTPHIIISIIAHIVHILLQYAFLYHFGLGIIGSSVAQAIAYFVLFILTLIYTMASTPYKNTWRGWDRQCLLAWGPFVSLGFYGMLMMCLEWWVWDASVLVAGYLGPTELAAQSIIFNVNIVYSGISLGLGFATSILVGQNLGASLPNKAKTTALVGLSVSGLIGIIWMVLVLATLKELPKIFTSDPEVVNRATEVLPLFAINILGESIMANGRCILRGIGKQKWGTICIFIAFYMIMAPIALPLSLLTSLGITGLWIGCIAAVTSCAITYVVIIFIVDWEKLSQQAVLRATGVAACQKTTPKEYDESSPLLGLGETKVRVSRTLTVFFCLLLPFIGLLLRYILKWSIITQTSSFNATTAIPVNSTVTAVPVNLTITGI